MSRMEDMARKGRIVELREELGKQESTIVSLSDVLGSQSSTILSIDRLDGETIMATAKMLRDVLNSRKWLLGEITRLER